MHQRNAANSQVVENESTGVSYFRFTVGAILALLFVGFGTHILNEYYNNNAPGCRQLWIYALLFVIYMGFWLITTFLGVLFCCTNSPTGRQLKKTGKSFLGVLGLALFIWACIIMDKQTCHDSGDLWRYYEASFWYMIACICVLFLICCCLCCLLADNQRSLDQFGPHMENMLDLEAGQLTERLSGHSRTLGSV